jgi:hypothetical protein
MAKDDPKAETPALAMTQEQFAQLLSAVRDTGNVEQTNRLEQILLKTAEVSAQTMKRALKPENETHPGISVFSYPEGDVSKPRPALPFQLFWNNFPIHKFVEQHHWYELQLFSQLTPGEYHVSLANDEGAQPITVKADYDANRQITKLDVIAAGMDRNTARSAPPIAVWAYQMIHSDRPRGETYIEGTAAFMRHVVQHKPPVREAVSA